MSPPSPGKGVIPMQVIVTLHGKNRAEQALMRQLATLAQRQRWRPISRFPFNLLEQMLRAGLDRVESLIRTGVLAAERLLMALKRLLFG